MRGWAAIEPQAMAMIAAEWESCGPEHMARTLLLHPADTPIRQWGYYLSIGPQVLATDYGEFSIISARSVRPGSVALIGADGREVRCFISRPPDQDA